MKKIKGRKPFSSVTLDNALPKTLEDRATSGILMNHRKNFEKKLLSHTTEQENR
jgi:hypothetical protein